MIVNQTGGGSGEKYSKKVYTYTLTNREITSENMMTIALGVSEDDIVIAEITGVYSLQYYNGVSWAPAVTGALSTITAYKKGISTFGEIQGYKINTVFDNERVLLYPAKNSANAIVKMVFGNTSPKIIVTHFKKE